jgi:multiple antibiotic resistance protein
MPVWRSEVRGSSDAESAAMTEPPVLGVSTIFILFLITLGPLKLLGPFAQQTRELDPVALRAIAVRVFVVGLIAVVFGGYLGMLLAAKWRISLPAMLLTAGIILFLVALQLVMRVYEAAPAAPPPLPTAPMAATLRLTFPLVVTPYGIAALIALLAARGADGSGVLSVFAVVVVVMVLDLLAMIYVREIMQGVVLLILQILGAVLGVLQVGLAIQIILAALRELRVLSA